MLSQKAWQGGQVSRCVQLSDRRKPGAGRLRSLWPGQARRSWKLLIRLVSGTRSELTACGSSHH